MATITDLLGRVLQRRYRLEAALGAGAAARVYLAHDLDLDRDVAVKILHPGLAEDRAFLRRFQTEAQIAAALNHPNIVQVYDWGEEDGAPFLVLEYLAGGSLRDLLDRGAYLGPAEVAQIGAQAARGLDYAHRRGLVHRDVKPANLLFDAEGDVHIADFGLARALADAAWTEPTGSTFGTARYAAPEQIAGHGVDGRSDVYSLGLVCYEALVGRAPFRADTTLGTLMARVNQPLPMPPALGPLAPILAAATIAEPLARPDAGALSADLELLAATLPIARIPIEGRVPPPPAEAPAPTDGPDRIAAAPAQSEDTIVFQAVAASAAPAKSGRRRQRRERGGRRRWLWLALAGLLLIGLLVAGGVGTYVHFGVYGHETPHLVGRSATDAAGLVQGAGLRLGDQRAVYSATAPAGVVTAQSLRAGTHQRAGTRIDLVVSKGHAPVALPPLVGQQLTASYNALHAAHFIVRVRRVYNESVPADAVIAATPASGNAPYGSTVALRVSRGPHPRTIPNLVGLSIGSAKSTLHQERLLAKVVEMYSDTVPAGSVLASRPAAGATGISVGATVTLDVSLGPQLVAVPSVGGQPIATAVAALQAAGLVVSEQIGPPFATTATTTDPAPGSQVRSGTNVTLYVQ